MAITEKTEYDSITILMDGMMMIRRSRVIIDNDGVTEISRNFFREVLEPGQNVAAYPARLRNLCAFIWTPQVIADYLAAKAARLAAMQGL